jgi:hypothetical protein
LKDQEAWNRKLDGRMNEALFIAARDNTYRWVMTRPPGFVRVAAFDDKRGNSVGQDVPVDAVIEMADNPLVQSVRDLAADLDKSAEGSPITTH